MSRAIHSWILFALVACGAPSEAPLEELDAQAEGGSSAGGAEPEPELPPEPAEGEGLRDPATRSLHNRRCGGTDWQHVGGWLLLPHAAPEIGPADEMQRCVDRYAGWVTNEADAAGVSRASVYAALAATGQCDEDAAYDGSILPGSLCTLVHPGLGEAACLDQLSSPKNGIATLAAALAATVEKHDQDVPSMAAMIGQGAIGCGGDDRWKLVAPEGFIDRYVAAYNAYTARTRAQPACKKRLVVTVALYTGMDDPGDPGVAEANGCWTYERIAKWNGEWRICNYDGTVHHPDGVKWAYDDTNTNHSAALDESRILACKNGVQGRGYVYMTNRGHGWPKRVENGVAAHFAQVYSGQNVVYDQLSLWVSAGKPGYPMVNFGEPTTGQNKIYTATKALCGHVADGGYLGVYVYPESLRANRMNAMVEALNDCTQ